MRAPPSGTPRHGRADCDSANANSQHLLALQRSATDHRQCSSSWRRRSRKLRGLRTTARHISEIRLHKPVGSTLRRKARSIPQCGQHVSATGVIRPSDTSTATRRHLKMGRLQRLYTSGPRRSLVSRSCCSKDLATYPCKSCLLRQVNGQRSKSNWPGLRRSG